MLVPALSLALLSAPAGIDDLKVGSRCVLKQDVSFQLRGTSVQTIMDRGAVVTVTHVGESISRIAADGEEGLVTTAELIEACAPENERCYATSAFRARSEPEDGQRKIFRVKPGAEVLVIERGAEWTRIEVSGIDAEAKSSVIKESCGEAPKKAGAGSTNDPLLDAVRPVPRDVTTVLLPMAHNGSIEESSLTYFEEQLGRVMTRNYPRVQVPAADVISMIERDRAPKALFQQTRVFPAALKVDFVIVTHIAETSKDHFLLSAVLYDQNGKRRAALRARPTFNPKDNWANRTIKQLMDARLKKPKKKKR